MLSKYAVGDCVVCSKECEHSMYWVAMEQQWDKATSLPVTDFRIGIDRPLCGPVCAKAYDGPSFYTGD